MNRVVAYLTMHSLLGRRRAIWLALLPALLLLLAVLVRVMAGIDEHQSATLLDGFALGTVVPLLGLIAGTGAIGPEIDDGSIVYLLAKPVNRHSIVISKLTVAIGAVVVFAAVPTFGAGLILAGTRANLAAGYAVAAAVAGIAYCALFLLLAILTRTAVVIGLLYAVVWEGVVGGFVPGAQSLSVRQWALTLTARVVGPRAAELGVTPAVSLVPGTIALAALVVLSTWYAGARLKVLRLASDD